MRFRTNFEERNGYRLWCDERSILLGSVSRGSSMPDDMLLNSTKALEDFSDSVMKREPLPEGLSSVVKMHEIVSPSDDVAYKYVPETTWKYLESGSFQLGSASYYRTIENKSAQDPREGQCLVAFRHGPDLVRVVVGAGYNCGIFCGTRTPNEAMKSKFGNRLIRIEPLTEFAEAVRIRLRGTRALIRDVVYTNQKTVIIDHEETVRLGTHLKEMNGLLDIKSLNRNFFRLFYEAGLVSTLFVKPAHYSHEAERRIIIEKAKDLASPTIRFTDRSLLKYISIVD